MVFSVEDKALIKCLRESKKYGAKRLLRLFTDRQWKISGLRKLIRKIDETGSVDRRPGSGRRRTARTSAQVEKVDGLSLGQEEKLHTHGTQRDIARQTGMSF